jgi:hypothetical protein
MVMIGISCVRAVCYGAGTDRCRTAALDDMSPDVVRLRCSLLHGLHVCCCDVNEL